ncbi:MAG: rhodanese-like domain-containing protein [Terriglobia bacterium]
MARLLHDRGYTDVRPLLGGFDAWMALGYPVERHAAPDLTPVVITAPDTPA